MVEDNYRIWCLVEGESTMFPVIASRTIPIADLKKLIKEKKNRALNDVAAKDLRLWRVRMTIASDGTTNSPSGECPIPKQK
jgi:Crinkler effector protein N-terminal domain